MSLAVRAPLAGTVVAVEQVPDPVFAGKFVGPGVAIDPCRVGDVTAVAPIDGTVAKVHPHAFIVVGADGRGVLTHLGLDTVGLAGAGFVVHVEEGDTVRAGDPIVTWNPGEVEAGGLNPIVPVIALEADEAALALAEAGTELAAGQTVLDWS
ncbi:PTS sugar transporter subunit IIA [Actinomyces faecalis]|uniref:PTS sugar transporter subunit IIA n=1 Tax=Actinomyces faecalis TaxID=2722820 RepID=UPI001554975A|nr:PTS glucose transporter subunit IIA [Actinomyces faecalis]